MPSIWYFHAFSSIQVRDFSINCVSTFVSIIVASPEHQTRNFENLLKFILLYLSVKRSFGNTQVAGGIFAATFVLF